MQVREECWRFQGASFGISTLPKKVYGSDEGLGKKMEAREKGSFCLPRRHFTFVPAEKSAERNLGEICVDLLKAGLKINLGKSILKNNQTVKHLGQWINLKEVQPEIPKV